MKSPITGKAMKIHIESKEFTYRKEKFEIEYHSWFCEESGEYFEDEKMANLNHTQVLNKYRAKYNLPFRREIIELRERYGLSAAKMSEILGFGINTYRLYESGEIPSISNARLLQLASDPDEFLELIKISKALNEKELKKLLSRIESYDDARRIVASYSRFLETGSPGVYNGYRSFDFFKTAALINRITEKTEVFKTKLNKLLFYIDFYHFRNTGNSITGLQYNAIPWGPVPNNFSSLFTHLTNLNYIDTEYVIFKDCIEGERFLPVDLENKYIQPLDEDEIESADFVLEKFGGMTSNALSKLSHKEPAWLINKEKKAPINYELGFKLVGI